MNGPEQFTQGSAGAVVLVCLVLCLLAGRASSQVDEETLSGPDSHETGDGRRGHLLGEWGGLRAHLFDRGVKFDVQ